MRNRFLLVAAATVLAVVVLGVSLLVGEAGGPAPSLPGPDVPRGADGELDGPMWTGPGMQQPRDLDDWQRGGSVLGDAGAGGGTYIFEEGRTIVTVGHVNPERGATGVYRVTDPAVRRLLSEDRLLVIRADAGEIVAPDQQPRQGNFRGDVVVTLYELDPERAARDGLTESDVVLRVFLDYVDFDMELGAIESTSDVLVTGPTVDFRGTGLSLIYNDLHDRLQKLEILRGRSARFRLAEALPGESVAPADEPNAAAGTEEAGEATAPQPEASVGDVVEVATSGSDPSIEQATAAAPAERTVVEAPPFYRARFENEVRITGSPERVDMTADYLDAVFAMAGRDDGVLAGEATPGAGQGQGQAVVEDAGAPVAAGPAAEAASAATRTETVAEELTPSALVAFALPPKPARLSMMPISDDDVVLNWNGRMIVEPELAPPADLVQAEDVLLRLVGRPVRIATADDETVLAGEAEYQTGSRLIRARGSAAQPVLVTSPRLGRLQGQALMIDQSGGTGWIQGPGTLTADQDANAPLAAQWQDRLNLRFFVEAGDTELDALQSASFVGPVRITDPRFTLEAGESLVVDLTDPRQGEQVLRRLQAAGDVALTAREDEERWLDINGQSLAVDFAADAAGDAYPTRVVARERVTTRGPGMTLQSELLDVTLDPELAAATGEVDATSETTGQSGVVRLRDTPVRSLLAQQRVRVELEDPAVILTGDRLVAAGQSGRLDLYGSPDRTVPARIEQRDATIQGGHIVLLDEARQLSVPGPGTFDARLDRDDPDQQLAVVWSRQMQFDDLAGEARFEGAVTATTRGREDASALTAETLDLEFVATPDPQAAAETDPSPLENEARQLRRLTATDRVKFTNSAYGGPTGNTLMTRLTLSGDKLIFDNRSVGGGSEQVLVPGTGRMLIEDYRPADAPRSLGNDGIALSGQGATLFQWDERMVLDAGQSTATLVGNVQMLHQPQDASELEFLQLDADRLVADLQDAGGLGGVLSDDGGDLDLQYVRADGAVHVIADDRQVRADHLQYTASDEEIRLWANPGRLVEVQTEGSAVPTSAEQFRWNLRTNRMEIDAVSPGIIPLP